MPCDYTTIAESSSLHFHRTDILITITPFQQMNHLYSSEILEWTEQLYFKDLRLLNGTGGTLESKDGVVDEEVDKEMLDAMVSPVHTDII